MTTPTNQAIPFDGPRDGVRAGSAALIGTSATIRGFKHALPSLAHADVPLIITGELGTGKSEWAQAIHRHSGRAGRPFHVVPMATLPEPRLERRLFGEPGKEGVLAQGHGSTVYLAGVDTLSPRLQQRLAQWLAVENAGAARIIAGSRTALDAQVRLGRFSRPLFQRLALVQLTIAPLRERVDDVAAIVEDALWHARTRVEDAPLLVRESALGELAAYGWPENVRELVTVLTTMQLETRTSTITVELVRAVLRRLAQRAYSLDVLPLERVESDYIMAALALCDGNQTLTARRLGIGRSTLLRKLKAGAPRCERAA
ncbi:MAG: sigma-54-dependent Fis family transcriptional regulator [Deltaproteobacteria bacterium]|nr:sigma-54-dependent Fis family transcriptional regulator [Deltaproteobacteria bacterium]